MLLTTFVSHKGWLIAHIILIFTGYAALVLSFGASLLYLLQERRLKAKKSTSLISFLPALEVIDQIGYRSLLLGFPFMTLGLITGSIVAAYHLRPHGLPRSQDSAVAADVGRLYGDGLHPLELRMARAPRRLPGDLRLRGRAGRLGSELFLRDPQVRRLMRFQLIGVNHKSAPLEVRERLAIPESRLPDTCRELTAYPGIEEGMVISTCNRVEIVAHTTNGSRRPARIPARPLSSHGR